MNSDRQVRTPPWRALATLVLCSALAAWPAAAGAEEFPWQQIYTCSMFSNSVSQLLANNGRNGAELEQQFDRLVTAALYRHKAEYLKTHPSAAAEELRRAWEAGTDDVERAFEASVDHAPDALAFLKEGYGNCAPLRAALLRQP